MGDTEIALRELQVLGTRARIFEGGSGAQVLLIHGGWTGAALSWSRVSWSRVWEALAARYRVVAPDLPGLGLPETP